ncbi:hypothetical protein QQ045_018372 [Rhodiola kirilowii]
MASYIIISGENRDGAAQYFDPYEEDGYDDNDGGSRLLGFMFGNVDNSGDLDVDYLDEDAKEHLAALADKLGPSLTDIEMSVKARQGSRGAVDQDYDEKAEDAIDYEDIDEQYEGPEIQPATEEDHLLPRKDFYTSEVSVAAIEQPSNLFDDENYDEDEEVGNEPQLVENALPSENISVSVERCEFLDIATKPVDEPTEFDVCDTQVTDVDRTDSQAHTCEVAKEQLFEDKLGVQCSMPLPVLCVEDGHSILRFSEIFCIYAPPKKVEKRSRRYPIPKDRYKFINASENVEEDEEIFLKGSYQGYSGMKQVHSFNDSVTSFPSKGFGSIKFHDVGGFPTMHENTQSDYCLSARPLTEDTNASMVERLPSPVFYPLEQQNWEDQIIWGDSDAPSASSSCSYDTSETDADADAPPTNETGLEGHPVNDRLKSHTYSDEKDPGPILSEGSIFVEAFGSRGSMELSDDVLNRRTYHPQLLRLESTLELHKSADADARVETELEDFRRSDTIRGLSKLTLINRELADGSWLDSILWELHSCIPKPKLIFDLQDEEMLFEILDNKEGKHLKEHAGAMIVSRSLKSFGGDSAEQSGRGSLSVAGFNIANDKFYSNRKTSQQLKSHSKKRSTPGLKVLHSTPAQKLQTMKLRLSYKDIANFHRPKAVWYPHVNEVVIKEQEKLCTQGPMKIILKSLGGKGTKLHVDTQEATFSVKAKASKKLDFKPSEIVRIYCCGKELEDDKTLAEQNVQPNSLLHLVRTKIHLLPRAQKLPGDNKPLRPPGAFKKKADLSAKDGHIFLMEYCEERPLLLGNAGMGARLCTYYQKSAPNDQTALTLKNSNKTLGSLIVLDPADKSPFLGEIKPGCYQSSLETNMYRAPVFPHKVASTDYLLIRSAKGRLSIRRIDRVDAVGQQEPHMEVMSPGEGVKGPLPKYISNRLLVYIYREFLANEKRGLYPRTRADELAAQFPQLKESLVRKLLKHCADYQRGPNGQFFWVMRQNFRLPSEEELRRLVPPEHVCAYESMQAGLYRLRHLGIMELTHPTGISSAMNQLPDEAIALAAASHIERELQITPWTLSSNFVGCTNQDRDNIERLEITGVGDPSGRGLGFSYVRTAPKAPISNAAVKKKTTIPRGGTTVTGTDADLRRLSMEAAREVLLKFNVPEEQIAKLTRWHRIAMIRKLSSEQAASGMKVDATTIGKYARGQRMSFLQLQQQTREKCQEIWDKQLRSLSVVDGDENDSESEANSDLDSFAGDLENLLDAEEYEEEENNYEAKTDRPDGVRGLKMRRHPTQPLAEEEIEDEAAEAAELCRMLMDDDEVERKKKKKNKSLLAEQGLATGVHVGFLSETAQLSKRHVPAVKHYISENDVFRDSKKVDGFMTKKSIFPKVKHLKKDYTMQAGTFNKKVKIIGDVVKSIKEKKSARESFICGACGQLGHMRTNKNCPKYREDTDFRPESAEFDRQLVGTSSLDLSSQPMQKTMTKKLIAKTSTKIAVVETMDHDKSSLKAKTLKFKCGLDKKNPDTLSAGKTTGSDAETGNNHVKVNKIIITSKSTADDMLSESHSSSFVSNKDNVEFQKALPSTPEDAHKDHFDSLRPSVVIRPPVEIDKEQSRKKIVIKRPKEVIDLDMVGIDETPGFEYRKTKKIAELSNGDHRRKQENKKLAEESARLNAQLWEEEERMNAEKLRIERERMIYEEEMRVFEEQERVAEIARFEEAIRKEREEEEYQKARKKKKKLPDYRDEYVEDSWSRRNDKRMMSTSKRKQPSAESPVYMQDYGQQTKRRRRGEVGLSNILEKIVEVMRNSDLSYLFQKPVSRKEAPDYFDIIKRPMDLSTIREKVRKLEYKSSEEFRHDVWQITYNAHMYNDGRNPSIPPLADQLLELCDILIDEHGAELEDVESSINNRYSQV